jgi:hypothetical protein
MRGFILSLAVSAVCLPIRAADTIDASINPQEIIQKFAAKETEFSEARNNYTYRQTVKLEVLDGGGNPTGEQWNLVEDIIFTPEGKRMEKVVYAPVQTLRQIVLTPSDEQDLRNVQPFVMTTAEIPEYDVSYLGREKVDEIGTYAFSVKPKKLVSGKRYFEGQIWVDDRDLQIVKTYGKGVGVRKGDEQFPKFETYREQIDGKYWFPTYTRANDTLHFKDQDVRIRMVVTYKDYKKYQGKSTIKYGDIIDDSKKPGGPPSTTPK